MIQLQLFKLSALDSNIGPTSMNKISWQKSRRSLILLAAASTMTHVVTGCLFQTSAIKKSKGLGSGDLDVHRTSLMRPIRLLD